MSLQPMTIIPQDYVKEYRPQPQGENGGPVVVSYTVFIHDVSTISALNMDFRLDMYLAQTWQDHRLEIPREALEDGEEFLILPSSFLDKIWQPQPYISNAKSSQILALTQEFSSLTVFYNKTIKYNIRLSVTLGCQMEFRQFPMDVQECAMTLETFSYDVTKVRLQWANAREPVVINPTLKLLQFDLITPITTETNTLKSAGRSGEYSQLKANFRFERYIGYHLIQVFFPSFLIVALSWFSFYLGLDAIPGRCTVLITTFLALITMFSGMKGDLPPVSYIKAVDIWMAVCMLFLFAATAEFIAVKYLDAKNKQNKVAPLPSISERISSLQREKSRGFPLGSLVNGYPKRGWETQGRLPPSLQKLPPYVQLVEEKHRHMDYARKRQEKNIITEIEAKSRLAFPLAFAVFSIIYWPLLLFRKI